MPIKPLVAERLGRRVATLRKKRRLGQEGLGGCSAGVICRLEKGATVPSVEKLDKIARGLDVSLSELFDFEPGFDTSRETAIERQRNRRANLLHRLKQMLRLSSPADINDILHMIFYVFRIKRRELPLVRRQLQKLKRWMRGRARKV